MGWRKRRQWKWTKDKEKGNPEKKHKGEHKKEDTKGKVAGLSKKGEEFWDYVRQSEIVGLVENWVEQRSWKK
jgi:hypothetical protein